MRIVYLSICAVKVAMGRPGTEANHSSLSHTHNGACTSSYTTSALSNAECVCEYTPLYQYPVLDTHIKPQLALTKLCMVFSIGRSFRAFTGSSNGYAPWRARMY